MKFTPDLLLLTWTAGALDGLSYLRAHVFTANMTGNTVLLGLHIVQGQFGPFLHNLTSLFAFSAGCLLAALILGEAAASKTERTLVWVARIEFPLLLAFSGLWITDNGSGPLRYSVIVVAALALGIQSVGVKRLKIRGVATTFLTGTVTRTMTEIAHAMLAWRRSRPSRADALGAAALAAIFATYLAAAVTAGYLALHQSTVAAFIPLPTLLPVMFRRR